jgi:TonB family protein
MKLSKPVMIYLFILSLCQLNAQTSVKTEKPVNNYGQKSLRSFIEGVEKQAGINFIFEDNLINGINVSFDNDMMWRAELEKVLSEHNISFKEFGNNSIVLHRNKKTPKSKSHSAVVYKSRLPDKQSIQPIIKPIVVSKEELVYPVEAVKNEIEGSVLIKLFVTKKGEVNTVTIDSTSGYSILDSAAVSYAKRMKFLPAESNGNPRDIWLTMVFRFLFEKDSQL